MAIDREKILQTAQKFVDRKKYDRAIEEYRRIVQADPNDARTWLKIGDLQTRLQAFGDAVATYDRVGQFYAQQGFALKAIAVYKQIREVIRKHAPELADQYAHITPRLAEIYSQLGLVSDALAAYDELATRFQASGRDRDAIEAFERMVALDPTNPLPHLRLAEASCRVQELDTAIDSFWHAAELLLKLERRDDALKVVERILHFRQDPRFAKVAAELYLQRGDRESGLLALSKLQVCFQADPKDLNTLGLLALAFSQIEQEAKAIEVYKEMARIARESGEVDFYNQLVQHLSRVAPNDEQVRALQSLAVVGSGRSYRPSAPGIEYVEEVEELDEVDALVDEVEEAEELEVDEELSSEPVALEPSAPAVGATSPVDEAEEYADSESFDALAHSRKAVVDAESFRKLRLYAKSVETLHIALEIDPRSVEIRDKLRLILAESGDLAGAINETLTLAALHIEDGNVEAAQSLLEEVLGQDPEHPTALHMAEQLGLVVPASPAVGRSYYPSAELDDPFGSAGGDALPQFPLSERPPPAQPSSAPEEAAAAGGLAVEEVLEEAEFFAARGLYQDAKAILSEQLQRTPNHPLIMERLSEVDEMMAAAVARRSSMPGAAGAEAPDSGPDFAPPKYDVAASLDALDELGLESEMLESEGQGFASLGSEIDVEKVFEKFKEGVKAQVEESDSATHYDLGVAYREMGLLPDAIKEFELAARDPTRECMCWAMIGMTHLERQEVDEALRAYTRGLSAKQKTAEQEMSLFYDLGRILETQQKTNEALSYYRKILAKDPGYRDVEARIAAIGAASPAPLAPRGDEDEFDQIFDDLFDRR